MNKEGQKLRLEADDRAGPEWADWLRNLDGNIYHSAEWADTRRSSTSRPLFFHWRDQSNSVRAIAVGIESWSSVPLMGRYSKRMELESYPAVENAGEGVIHDLIDQLLDYSRKTKHGSLLIQSYYTDSDCPDPGRDTFESTSRLEWVIDLTLTEDQLKQNMSSTHRRKIGKARKNDLRLESACNLEAMRQFRKLQVQSRDRRLDRGEHIGTAEDSYYERLGRAYFERNLGRVYLLTNRGEPVSGAFVSMYAGKAYYVFGGSSDSGFAMNAPALLFWEIFSHCREHGCHEFNLGGVPASAMEKESQSHGLYRFKAGFGGRQIACVSLSAVNLQPGRDRIIGLAKKLVGR